MQYFLFFELAMRIFKIFGIGMKKMHSHASHFLHGQYDSIIKQGVPCRVTGVQGSRHGDSGTKMCNFSNFCEHWHQTVLNCV